MEIVSSEKLELDDAYAFAEVLKRINSHAEYNRSRARYYEAHRTVQDLGISTPPGLENIGAVIGWPATVVDALDERLDIRGFTAPGVDLDSLGVQQIWDDNELYREYSGAHVDSFIHGVAFIATSRGTEGEPDPLITVESPMSMSAIYDPRGRRITVAASISRGEDGQAKAASLYKPDSTTHLVREGSQWIIVSRDDHRIGRVLVRRLVNNPRASRHWGRSEITRDVIYLTQAAMRTLLGAEVSREFYSAPQRWIMGAKESAFEGPDGSMKSAWQTYQGRFIALTRDEDDDASQDPKIGQFTPQPPTPYIDLVKMYATMLSSTTGIPATYFGFESKNPPSADAIRAMETRHVKKASRRCTNFGPEWAGAIKDAILLRDGDVPKELAGLRTKWANPATPTVAATADATVKIVNAFPWLKESDVALEQLGFDQTDLDRLKHDRDRASAKLLATALAGVRPDEDQVEATERRGSGPGNAF